MGICGSTNLSGYFGWAEDESVEGVVAEGLQPRAKLSWVRIGSSYRVVECKFDDVVDIVSGGHWFDMSRNSKFEA